MSIGKIEAVADTFLKKEKVHLLQAKDIGLDSNKSHIKKGKIYQVDSFEEIDLHSGSANYAKVDLSYGAGEWYIYLLHWKLPWQKDSLNSEVKGKIKISLNEINWNTWDSPISKYFTVGEVINRQTARVPNDSSIMLEITKLARKLDAVREWWGSPLYVNSWYRPPHINKAIGGASNSQHIYGKAADIKPSKGSVYDFQRRFEKEWYFAGKWNGGFGRGAKRGFVHLDTGSKRLWNY